MKRTSSCKIDKGQAVQAEEMVLVRARVIWGQ